MSELERIYEEVGYSQKFTDESAAEMLSRMDSSTREFILQPSPSHWHSVPDIVTAYTEEQLQELKLFLGWVLQHGKYEQVCAVVQLIHGAMNASLLDDVMELMEQKEAGNLIPPRLLLRWAKILQNKGDLHGAVRRLNIARTLLDKENNSTGDGEETQKIRGECTQLMGLTLNKMCCWKDAVYPLMDSIAILLKVASSEKAVVVSLVMAAKCISNIPHEDFLELKHHLEFKHNDRFYQAYVMCKEAAALAGSSGVQLAMAQNQAAEALLKFAAQECASSARTAQLQKVVEEVQFSLRAYTALSQLSQRENLFQIVRSLFLVYLTLSFSDVQEDRLYAMCLQEWAMDLFSVYCKQLCEKGFLSTHLDVTDNLRVREIIEIVKTHFHLKIDTARPIQNPSTGKNTEMPKIKESQTAKSEEWGVSSVVNICGNRIEVSSWQPRDSFQGKTQRHQEVGLPIIPSDYDIPLYDVPHSIFQNLCGCKFRSENRVKGTYMFDDYVDNELKHALNVLICGNGKDEGSGKLSGTQDSGYGSAVALVETFLTTKLSEKDEADGLERSGSSTDRSASSSVHSCCGNNSSCNVLDVTNNIKRASLFKFNPVTGLWTCQTTLVFLGPSLPLDDKVKGHCRDAFDVQFLHQDEVLGRYVGKRYRRQKPASQYLQDLTCQKIARFLVTLFNFALRGHRYDIQVVYVPVAHLQILSDKGEVEDWLNVEPYLQGDFIKLTNNLHFCNSQGRTLATSLTHFTHSVSEGRLMLVDLQGWLPREGRGVVYLTDPQFHTSGGLPLSACDMGQAGMQAFWTSVHPHCNEICAALDLKRPC